MNFILNIYNYINMSDNETNLEGNKQQTSVKCKKIGDYILGKFLLNKAKTIGRGGFGKVKIGIHIQTEQKVAIKILDKSKIKDDHDVERINREIKILKKIRHNNLVQLYDTIC